jgi:hypothetical protein
MTELNEDTVSVESEIAPVISDVSEISSTFEESKIEVPTPLEPEENEADVMEKVEELEKDNAIEESIDV